MPAETRYLPCFIGYTRIGGCRKTPRWKHRERSVLLIANVLSVTHFSNADFL